MVPPKKLTDHDNTNDNAIGILLLHTKNRKREGKTTEPNSFIELSESKVRYYWGPKKLKEHISQICFSSPLYFSLLSRKPNRRKTENWPGGICEGMLFAFRFSPRPGYHRSFNRNTWRTNRKFPEKENEKTKQSNNTDRESHLGGHRRVRVFRRV